MVNSSEAVDVDVVVDEHESRLEVKTFPPVGSHGPPFRSTPMISSIRLGQSVKQFLAFG